jgi:hypothetical protein
MYAKVKRLFCRPFGWACAVAMITGLVLHPGLARANAAGIIVYWVFDVGTADSQFGYWDGSVSKPVGGTFAGRDFEGMGCIGTTIYVTSGGDGKVPSQLVRLTFDKAGDTTTVTDVGTIQDANGKPFYEVSSLGVRSSDNTLWAYAAEEPTGSAGRGIIKINPATGQAELKQAATLDVAAVAWLDQTLYMAEGNSVYTWSEGGNVSNKLFDVTTIAEIEALDVTPGGNFYIGGDGTKVQEITPTGTLVNNNVFTVLDKQGNAGDPESLTFCQELGPTALEESQEPVQVPTALDESSEPLRVLPAIYLPLMRG